MDLPVNDVVEDAAEEAQLEYPTAPESESEPKPKKWYPAKPKAVHKPIEHSDRHDFGTPLKFQTPNRLDFNFFSAVPVLDGYNDQSWAHKMDPLLIEALSISPTLFYGMDTTSAVHCLVRHNTFIKIQIKVMCDLDYGWEAGTVMIKDDDRWTPLRNYLKTLPPPKLPTTGKAGWKLQLQWWQRMKKPFRFLELPQELQKRTLLFAIGERVAVEELPLASFTRQVYSLTEGADAAKVDCDESDVTAPTLSAVNTGLLQLSKGTRELAIEVLFKDTINPFTHHTQLVESTTPLNLYTVKFTANASLLRKVELALTNRDYIDFFKVPLLPFNNSLAWNSTPAPATLLKTLHHLNNLEIFFRSTVATEASPWYQQYGSWNTNNSEIDHERFPCQKKMVDIIMSFAYEHVKDIRRVRLTGYVEKENIDKWEGMLNAPDPSMYDEIVEVDKSDVRRLTASELSPRCDCRIDCHYPAFEYLAKLGRCHHGRWDSCFCFRHAAKSRDYKQAYKDYDFDFEDDDLAEAVVGRMGSMRLRHGGLEVGVEEVWADVGGLGRQRTRCILND